MLLRLGILIFSAILVSCSSLEKRSLDRMDHLNHKRVEILR
jgi:hypothetical protein